MGINLGSSLGSSLGSNLGSKMGSRIGGKEGDSRTGQDRQRQAGRYWASRQVQQVREEGEEAEE